MKKISQKEIRNILKTIKELEKNNMCFNRLYYYVKDSAIHSEIYVIGAELTENIKNSKKRIDMTGFVNEYLRKEYTLQETIYNIQWNINKMI